MNIGPIELRKQPVTHAVVMTYGDHELGEELAAVLKSFRPPLTVTIVSSAAELLGYVVGNLAHAFVLCDATSKPDTIQQLLDDHRKNVIAVELAVRRDLSRSRRRFQLEPVDVPWYTRRVVGFGDVADKFAQGHCAGAQIIGAEAYQAFGEIIAERGAADAVSDLIEQGHEFYAMAS